jgi:RNA polymerase sigma-70 factor (ECF subfamily)
VQRADLSLESTAQLLSALQDGNDTAREILFDRYLGRLQRWARGRLPLGARDLMNTDDLVQQTLSNVLAKVDSFEPKHAGGFQGYLRQTILNLIRDQARRAARRPITVIDDNFETMAALNESPLEAAIGKETLERYERALANLRSSDRDLVIANVELSFDYEEIAREFGKSTPNAARMAVSRALRRLAAEIARSENPED